MSEDQVDQVADHIREVAARSSDREFAARQKGQRRAELREWVKTIVAIASFVLIVVLIMSRTGESIDLSKQRLATAAQVQSSLDELKSQGANLEGLVKVANGLNSPAAQKAQQERLQATIASIGCDTGGRLQKLVDELVQAGVIGRVSVDCPPPATTTTEAGR